MKESESQQQEEEELHNNQYKEFLKIMEEVTDNKCGTFCKIVGNSLYNDLRDVANKLTHLSNSEASDNTAKEEKIRRKQLVDTVNDALGLLKTIQEYVKDKKVNFSPEQSKTYEAFEYSFAKILNAAKHTFSCMGAKSQEDCQNISLTICDSDKP